MLRRTHDVDYCLAFCRLEDRNECNYWTGHTPQKCGDAKIYERLREYEATGLTPEDFKALRGRENGLAQLLVQVSCNCSVTFTRLRELAQAEKDGRLVELPCKMGSVVYGAETSPAIPLYVIKPALYLEGAEGGDFETLDNFGKTVFLTREDAERALNKEDAT